MIYLVIAVAVLRVPVDGVLDDLPVEIRSFTPTTPHADPETLPCTNTGSRPCVENVSRFHASKKNPRGSPNVKVMSGMLPSFWLLRLNTPVL